MNINSMHKKWIGWGTNKQEGYLVAVDIIQWEQAAKITCSHVYLKAGTSVNKTSNSATEISVNTEITQCSK